MRALRLWRSRQKSTEELFARAGLPVKVKDRNYFPTVEDDGLSLVLFRSQEILATVADGVLDAGICGRDWIVENGSDVVEVAELKYSKATSNPARWVVAVPEDSPVETAADLEGTLIASELVHTTERFFLDRGIQGVKVEYSWGATEVKASLPGVGAIVDITETGSSLRANKLREVATILESTTRLIANKDAWKDPIKRGQDRGPRSSTPGRHRRQEEGRAQDEPAHRVGSRSSALSSRAKNLSTVSPLLDEDYCAVEVVVDEGTAKDLVPLVRRMGATGIVTYPINLSIH